MVTAYTVIDTQTDAVVGTSNSTTSAYAIADRFDNDHAAIRSRVVRNREVSTDEERARDAGVSA